MSVIYKRAMKADVTLCYGTVHYGTVRPGAQTEIYPATNNNEISMILRGYLAHRPADDALADNRFKCINFIGFYKFRFLKLLFDIVLYYVTQIERNLICIE